MKSSTNGELAAAPPAPASPEMAIAAETAVLDPSPDLSPMETEVSASDVYWRREVADRLQRYRSRRKPRAPRYPSLRLPFDAAENPSFASTIASLLPAASVPAARLQPPALQPKAFDPEGETQSSSAYSLPQAWEPPLPKTRENAASEEHEPSNLIEFPRSAVVPVYRGTELAEAVLDRPRIVEAPEVIPPPPALGGILMETVPARDGEKHSEDLTLQRASFVKRILAALIDGLILTAALAGLAEIFFYLNPALAPVPVLAAGLIVVAIMLWSAYELLFVVYTGSTPGWRLARLRLVKFDGSPVSRGLRRCRVLASLLSAFSLGLGYFWSILDENGLCWHDRITHTCLQSSTQPE